jgi:predicted dehydrogenase
MTQFKTVAIVGLGIGKLYVDVCKLNKWNVITVDLNPDMNADFQNLHDALQTIHVDMGIICTPNFTHQAIAEQMAKAAVPVIVVEKPGFVNVTEWTNFYETFPSSKLFMVKNNQYRDILNSIQKQDIDSIQLFWANKNRIPGAGSWFTNKALAFGGVSRDLLPHLVSVVQKILGHPIINRDVTDNTLHAAYYQQYGMSDVIDDSSYGNFHENGIYDTDDCAYFTCKSDGIAIQCVTTWKHESEADIVAWKFFMKDGTVNVFNAGLCPEIAYQCMLQDYMDADVETYKKHQSFDTEIHGIFEYFQDTPQSVIHIKQILDENKNIA